MRRFEFDDGSSKKFWEIQVDGESYTVHYGRLGTNGQTSTKVFSDAAEAEKKAASAIASKVKKGYVETEAVVAPADPAAELLDRLRADPDDLEGWGVLADKLQAGEDPRGELISVQMAIAASPADASLRAHEAELLEKHAIAFFGDVRDGRDEAEACTFTWRNGFWHTVRVGGNWDIEDVDIRKVLGFVLRHPSSALLHSLAIGLLDVDGEADMSDAVNILVKHGRRPGLRRLHIGAYEPEETEISWIEHSSVERLGAILPDLEELELTGGGIELGELRVNKLRHLKLETGGLPAEPVERLAAGSFPALEELDLYLGCDDYGASVTAEHVAALLANTEGLPSLRKLGIKNAEIADDINGVLMGGRLLRQLTHLDLSMGTMTDAGAEALLAAMPKLQHLVQLDVSENYLTDAMEKRLAAAFPGELVTGTSKENDGEWFFTSVAE